MLRDLWNKVGLLWVPSEARFRKSGIAELQPAGQVALQPDFVNMFLLEHGHIHPFTYILYCCLLATRLELTNWNRDCMACKTESIYYLVLNRKMYCFHALWSQITIRKIGQLWKKLVGYHHDNLVASSVQNCPGSQYVLMRSDTWKHFLFWCFKGGPKLPSSNGNYWGSSIWSILFWKIPPAN